MECTIYITTRRGRAWKYRRDEGGWTQTGPNGKVRPMTAEQLLSHILPPLAAGTRAYATVTVVPDRAKKTKAGTKSESRSPNDD